MHPGIKASVLTLLAAAILLPGCQSDQSPEQLETKQASEREKMEAKQKAEQEQYDKKMAKAEAELEELKTAAEATRKRAETDIANVEKYYDSCVGYVIFPKIAKGGLVVGGAHGNGIVYERRAVMKDKMIGSADVSQGSIGFQIGGQTFSEVIFFEDDMTFENFKKSNLEFSGTASGVAGGAGATEAAKYENGVAIFVFGQKGLMGEASIGGQKFNYMPFD
jgi:lipid-binding SYLF domain-containing protein